MQCTGDKCYANIRSPPPHVIYASTIPQSPPLSSMPVPPPSQLYMHPTTQPLPIEQKKKEKSNPYLIPGLVAAVVAVILLIAFFYPIEAPLPQVSTTAVLPAPIPGSEDSLETVTNPQRAELIEQLIIRLKAQQQQGGLLAPPRLPKPSPGADLGTVLEYLSKRGANLDGHAWSEEALRALRNRGNWSPKEGYPPRFIYAAGFDTPHPFMLFFSPQVGDWGLTSSVDAKVI